MLALLLQTMLQCLFNTLVLDKAKTNCSVLLKSCVGYSESDAYVAIVMLLLRL